MPISESGSLHLAVMTTASPAQHTEVLAAHDCHEAMSEPVPETHAQLALHDVGTVVGIKNLVIYRELRQACALGQCTNV